MSPNFFRNFAAIALFPGVKMHSLYRGPVNFSSKIDFSQTFLMNLSKSKINRNHLSSSTVLKIICWQSGIRFSSQRPIFTTYALLKRSDTFRFKKSVSFKLCPQICNRLNL